MNINDFKAPEKSRTDRLEDIFARQRELMEKYHPIEAKNGLLITSDIPVNIHDARGQYRLKDFAWRITEELGEALEALEIHSELVEHFDEELADALHFLVEFTILAGVSPEYYLVPEIKFQDRLETLYYDATQEMVNNLGRKPMHLAMRVGYFVKALAMTCNTLKNKPWKQTQMMTDESYFRENLRTTWIRFCQISLAAGVGPQELFDLYFRKSRVNEFRQRSNY